MTSFMAAGQVGVIGTLAYPLDSEAFSAQCNLQHHHVIQYTMSKNQALTWNLQLHRSHKQYEEETYTPAKTFSKTFLVCIGFNHVNTR